MGALTVTTTKIADAGELLAHLPLPHGMLSWVHDGDGLVGWGEVARFTPRGADRFTLAQRWWERFTAGLHVNDELELPGSGPVAFASMAFADDPGDPGDSGDSGDPGDSVLVVPRVLIGRRDGVSWLTTVGEASADDPAPRPVTPPSGVRFGPGEVDADAHRRSVAAAVARIRAGELEKVVLSRDLVATADQPWDERYVLNRLAERYPRCWVYAVDGFLGATPESLLCRFGDQVSARLLAGTAWPDHDGSSGTDLASELLASAKNREEHEYGVRSLLRTLEPFCTTLRAPDQPEVLHLSNVTHLATDVTGDLAADLPLLELAAHVHPTAATGGTPTGTALAAIRELEPTDRGGYLGPVGWTDARGNGELGVALRCARLDGRTARLRAGGGIVADSDPDTEVAEATAKFRAIQQALQP